MDEIWVVGCEPIEVLSDLKFFSTEEDACKEFFEILKKTGCVDPVKETEDGLYCNTLGADLCFFCYKQEIK